jgi:tetratricopeptide (TPR) repeat protein
MNFILPLVFVVSGAIGQVIVSSDVENRYEEYRRAGLTAFLQANYKQAESHFRDALDVARSFGSSDRRVATVLGDLAVLYAKTRRLSEAEEFLHQSVTILQANDQGHDLCVILNALGQVYLSEDRLKEAERTLAVALSLARNGRGSMDGAVSDILSNIGLLQLKQKKYRQAEESFQRSLEIRQTSPAEANNFNAANTLNDLGTLYELQSHHSKAEEVLERSLKIAEELLPPYHPDLASILENLAVVENKLHHFEASEGYFRRTIAIQTPERAMSRPELLAVFADTLRNLNKQDEAVVLLAQMKRLLDQQRFTIKSKPS